MNWKFIWQRFLEALDAKNWELAKQLAELIGKRKVW